MTSLDVEFQSEGETVRGDLYLPEGDGPFPVIVMAGGWCYVKELRQPDYAKRFVEKGMAALIFDYRRFGASAGEPRQHLDPWDQIADYRTPSASSRPAASSTQSASAFGASPTAAATSSSSEPLTRG